MCQNRSSVRAGKSAIFSGGVLQTALLIGTLASLAYRSLHTREFAHSREALEDFYRLHMGHVDSQWKDDAEQVLAALRAHTEEMKNQPGFSQSQYGLR